MVLYHNETEKKECVLGKIVDMFQGRGLAKKIKTECVLEYDIIENGEKKKRREKVAFWDSKDPTKQKLSTKVRKEPLGTKIVAIISRKELEPTCLIYSSSSAYFSFDKRTDKEVNIIMGHVGFLKEENTKTPKGEFQYTKVGIPIGQTTEWHNITYWNTSKRPNINKYAMNEANKARKNGGMVVAVTGKASNPVKNSKGESCYSHTGFTVFYVPDSKKKLENVNNMVSIGPFKFNPISIDDFVKNEKSKRKEWISFICNEFVPANDFELAQKELIKKISK